MTDPVSLLPILEKLNTATILCVGDVMLDQFVYGDVDRISPEAPVPVLRVTRVTETPGGAGNVASNLCSLGCAVKLVGVVGNDDTKGKLNAALARLPRLTPALVEDSSRPTISKTRYATGPQQMLRVDAEDTRAISDVTEQAIIDAALKTMDGCNGVLLSDYGKGVLTPKVLRAVIGAAKAKKIRVFVDPKGRDYTRYSGADAVTPNRRELADATGGHATGSNAEVTDAARQLIVQAGIGAVIATRSADGMTVLTGPDDAPVHLATRAREVFDVSGAGDTVAAVAIACVAAGADLVSAATLANIAAGLVVEKVGTASIDADELHRAITDNAAITHGRTLAPISSWAEAKAQVERWKARGLTVGFTNGCFDIVHQGHVMMLDRCRTACDRLVLGLNTDASVSRLKGPARPVNGHDARARVVAALGSIDCVVLFGDNTEEKDTPLELIKTLRPDMLFKGQDYTVDKVVGADFVQATGGRVVLISLEEGFSTTNTIKKLGSAA